MNEARIRSSIEAYVAAWNEHDAARRMRLIEQACAENLLMRTPLLLTFVEAALPSRT